MVEETQHMGSWIQKLIIEASKLSLIVAIVLLFQSQFAGLNFNSKSDSNNIADAHAPTIKSNKKNDKLAQSLESSKAQLVKVQRDLETTFESIKREREEFEALISDQEEKLKDQLGGDFSYYQGHLNEALALLKSNESRIHVVESALRRAQDSSIPSFEESMLYPIIQLKGNKTVGSGVVIYSKTLSKGEKNEREVQTFAVTAYHVVKEILGEDFPLGVLDDVNVLENKTGQKMKVSTAVVEAFDAEKDLALLRLRLDKPFPYVARALNPSTEDQLDLFTKVYAVGCPLGNKPLPTYGEISSKTKEVGDQVFWMLTAPTFFGNSGGGIFLASDGSLVGISSMIYTYTYGSNRSMVVPHMGLFVPIKTVKEWLREEGFGHLLSEMGAPPAPQGIEIDISKQELPLEERTD